MSRRSRSPTPRQSAGAEPPTPRFGPLSCRRPIGSSAPPSVTDLPAILPEPAHIADTPSSIWSRSRSAASSSAIALMPEQMDTPSSSAIALMQQLAHDIPSASRRAQRLVFDAARALRVAEDAVKAAEEAVEESESVASILPTVRSLSSHERAAFIVHFENTFREGRKTLRDAVMQPQAQQQSL